MKGDAEQLISEAINLLGEHSSSRKSRNNKEKPASSADQTGKYDLNLEAQHATEKVRTDIVDKEEKPEDDRSKDTSMERSFWFKLAEQRF